MKDTKLLRALGTLKKEEWISFRRYILMNTGIDSELFSLFSIIQSRKMNFGSFKSPDKFRLKYFPNVSQKAFFGMLSKLYKWFEEWIAIYEMKISEYDKELYLIKGLLRKGLTKEAKSHSLKLQTKLENTKYLDFETSKVMAELSHIRYFSISKESTQEMHQLLLTASQKSAEHYKDRSQFYLAELINRGKIFDLDFNEVKNMLHASSNVISDSEISKLGKSIIKLVSDDDVGELNNLNNIFFESEFKNESELENSVYTYLRIYARRLFGQNKIIHVDSYVRLFDFNYQRRIEKDGEKIKQVDFHNQVDEMANFISFEKTKEFIDTWIDFVETSNRQATKDLAYSQIHFINRDFKKMSKFSQNISFDNYGQRTRAWLHHVICQYKFRNENYDQAIQALTAFKNYLKRNKKKYSKNYLTANLNTVILMEKLAKSDFKKVDIQLKDYKYIFYRTWITEEVEKLRRK